MKSETEQYLIDIIQECAPSVGFIQNEASCEEILHKLKAFSRVSVLQEVHQAILQKEINEPVLNFGYVRDFNKGINAAADVVLDLMNESSNRER